MSEKMEYAYGLYRDEEDVLRVKGVQITRRNGRFATLLSRHPGLGNKLRIDQKELETTPTGAIERFIEGQQATVAHLKELVEAGEQDIADAMKLQKGEG